MKKRTAHFLSISTVLVTGLVFLPGVVVSVFAILDGPTVDRNGVPNYRPFGTWPLFAIWYFIPPIYCLIIWHMIRSIIKHGRV